MLPFVFQEFRRVSQRSNYHLSLITYQRSSPLHPRRGERLQAGGGAQRNLCKLGACV